MPSSFPLGRTAAALLVASTLLLGGCASHDDPPSEPSAGVSPTVQTPSEAPTTEAPTPTIGPSPTGTPTPATTFDRLLPTASVPGLNATWKWQDGETAAAPTTSFGLCAKVDLLSIGATEVLQRTYFPPVDTDDAAAQQVAEFADTTSAAQAVSVLKSWRKSCTKKGTKVGPLTSVDGGSWYLVTRTGTNPDDGIFQSVGIVQSGTRVSVLTINVIGQDFNYPVGREPMVAMVKAASALLA